MRVLIVRHAVAVERGSVPVESDDERPLTAKGARRMRRIAAGLRRLVPRPAVVYSSPLVRARDTAEILVEAWREPPPLIISDVLAPGHQPVAVVRWLKDIQNDDLVALVGHEPGCGTLLAYLLGGSSSSFAVDFKKGGAALVDAATRSDALTTTLLWHATPRMLRLVGQSE